MARHLSSIYFDRNHGEWLWDIDLKILSWEKLWESDLTFLNKINVSLMVATQKVLGSFRMWTKVDFDKENLEVRHSTKIEKWSFTLYRSEKIFYLNKEDGSLRLEGHEFHWPMMWRPVVFKPLVGIVEDSTTRARYQMPFLGVALDCKSFLGQDEGEIRIENNWINGVFTLTPGSRNTLASRFD